MHLVYLYKAMLLTYFDYKIFKYKIKLEKVYYLLQFM